MARKILPDLGGENLVDPGGGGNFAKAWYGEEYQTIYLKWQDIFPSIVSANLAVVAFIQDYNTKEILQTAINSEYYSSTGTLVNEAEVAPNVIFYPNPAKEHVNIWFEQIPQESLSLMMYDISGKLVHTDQVFPNEQIKTVELNQLSNGLYIIELRKERNGAVYHRAKIFHHQ